MSPILLDLPAASVALGFTPESRWLLEPDCPVPRVDIRKVGAKLPLWRWRVRDLERFALERLVEPGRESKVGG